ncbi:hypothetical protein LguiA_000327 [Lonicera macranthoides]
MAATAASDIADGPVLSLINKRIRALRKKHNRIIQLEEAVSQGKTINKEQEEVLKSKPSITASIDELEKLRQPLSAAVADEVSLALQRINEVSEQKGSEEGQNQVEREHAVVEDLLNLIYFGSMFDVKTQNEYTSMMLTRTHERGCCLTYDTVTDDDSADLLGERDLDLISMAGGLVITRPVDSGLSHKNALQRCIEHAKLWISKSDQPIGSDGCITCKITLYAGLREKLTKIMGSDYFTTTPEIKAPVDYAAAGNYGSFQVPVDVQGQVEVPNVEHHHEEFLYVTSLCDSLEARKEGVKKYHPLIYFSCRFALWLECFEYLKSLLWYWKMGLFALRVVFLLSVNSTPFLRHLMLDDDASHYKGSETYENQSTPGEEHHKGELEAENSAEDSGHTEQQHEEEGQQNVELKEQQNANRRPYPNQRGARSGGGRRGYSNGRGGRFGGRGGGGPYQNGRNQYYDQQQQQPPPGNYSQRNYYNSRGRGGGRGGNSYNGSAVHAGNAPAES